MDQSTNNKLKIDFLISKNTSQVQTIVKSKRQIEILCNECNKYRYRLDESHHVCNVCYKAKSFFKPSGNKVTLIDDTRLLYGKMVFVPYDRFKNVEFIAEGGFSKVYKAIWNGPVDYWNGEKQSYSRLKNCTVVLKKLNDSNDVTSKELNELKVEFSLKSFLDCYGKPVCKYFGITKDPITQDIMIIMPYYESGDLINSFITNYFYSISSEKKLDNLKRIISGLERIHFVNIVHRDLNSGNLFFQIKKNNIIEAVIGDFGISKSATESTDDNNNNNENYGIIPYMAPKIFQGEKCTQASDIYNFEMIMWEFMTRLFWDRIHNTELIIAISCDGLKPPIVTNAPERNIELMKQCWHSDPKKKPKSKNYNILEKFQNMRGDNIEIVKSPEIGHVTKNNPGAIYKSRPLSSMIQSAMSTRSLRSQSINLETDSFQKSNISFSDKRKFEGNQIKNSLIDDGQRIKKMKLIENENDYVTKELELDIDTNDTNFN